MIQELKQQLRALARTPGQRMPGVWASLRELTDCEDLELVGQMLAGVDFEHIIPADRKLRPIKVGIASSFNSDAIASFLRVLLVRDGFAPKIHVAGYNQLQRELSDPASALCAFQPDVTVCLVNEGFVLPQTWNPAQVDALRAEVHGRAAEFEQALASWAQRSTGRLIVNTIPLPTLELRSVISFAGRAQFGRLWRELNNQLLSLPERIPAAIPVDLEALLVDAPTPLQDRRLQLFGSMGWRNEVLLLLAEQVASACRALAGLSKKCLVLDLDNTLWGGVLGDDGPEGIQIGEFYPGNAYRDLQHRLKALQQQGVILTVCSKNERTLVDEALERHPAMVLRPEDLATIVANWEPKDRNIAGIARQLNLGLDSFVFLDDSPFECELVAGSLPDVTVIRAGGEPADVPERLLRPGLFDVLATTREDQVRTQLYRAQAQRQEFAGKCSSGDDYLRGLGITVKLYPVDEYALPRLVQLNLRTNQFNMTTLRLSELQVREQMADPAWEILCFEVEDRFGHEGMVGAVWLHKDSAAFHIENFIMSCRVFSRNVEHAVLQHLLDRARAAGVAEIRAEYRPTAKNKVVAGLYPSVGFVEVDRSDERVLYSLTVADSGPIAPDWVQLETREGHLEHA